MKRKKLSVGIDIGGTKIRGIIFDGKNIMQTEERKYRSKPPTKKEFFSVLWGVSDGLMSGVSPDQLLGIGIGTAGNVSQKRIYAGPQLDVLNHVNLKDEARRRYGVPIQGVNDVQSGIVSEWLLGAGRGAQSVFMVTMSTGTSGAFIKNGKLQNGFFGSAHAVGFIIIDAERARRGEPGHLEHFASEQFFVTRGIDPKVANSEAQNGNKEMQALWREYGEYLGIGVATIINLFEPEVLVIGGGGLSNAWPLFGASVKSTAQRLIVHPVAREKTGILPAELGTNAGVIGAALLPTKLCQHIIS